MSNKAPFYLHKLRSNFEHKLSRNSQYSMRSYAKYLNLNAPVLSEILKGNRAIPKSKLEAISTKLNLSPKEIALFTQSNKNWKTVFNEDIHSLDFTLNEEVHFNIMAEWEHYAILSLTETKGFKSDIPWIAKKLSISEYRTKVCIDNLLHANLLELKNNIYTCTTSGVKTTTDISSEALKKGRKQDLIIAEKAIDEIDVSLRDMSTIVFTLNKKLIPEIKDDIKKFRRKLAKKSESIPGEEVYKLSVQLFPLTKINNQGDK